jgi:hypothetical protein
MDQDWIAAGVVEPRVDTPSTRIAFLTFVVDLLLRRNQRAPVTLSITDARIDDLIEQLQASLQSTGYPSAVCTQIETYQEEEEEEEEEAEVKDQEGRAEGHSNNNNNTTATTVVLRIQV